MAASHYIVVSCRAMTSVRTFRHRKGEFQLCVREWKQSSTTHTNAGLGLSFWKDVAIFFCTAVDIPAAWTQFHTILKSDCMWHYGQATAALTLFTVTNTHCIHCLHSESSILSEQQQQPCLSPQDAFRCNLVKATCISAAVHVEIGVRSQS